MDLGALCPACRLFSSQSLRGCSGKMQAPEPWKQGTQLAVEQAEPIVAASLRRVYPLAVRATVEALQWPYQALL
jgi:hypothetical protein